MSTINIITAMQSSILATAGKTNASQTVAAQPEPAANDSSASISSAGAAYAEYLRTIAEKEDGLNVMKRDALENATSSRLEDAAYYLAHDNSAGSSVGGLVSIAGKTPNDPINYSFGAPVTVESQAYFTKQLAVYQGQVLELYDTELAKGTTPGQIVCDIYDLQAKQPDAFRAMMMWPPATEPFSIEKATNPTGAPQQFLNAGGQVVKT